MYIPKDAIHAGDVVSSVYNKNFKKQDPNSFNIQEALSVTIKVGQTLTISKEY